MYEFIDLLMTWHLKILYGCLAALVILGGVAWRAQAGPVTNPGGFAPFTRLGIYKQVLNVVDEQGASNTSLVFGYAGRDIAGTGNIVFRPGTGSVVTAANGVRVQKNGSSADLYIPGKLCLYDHTNGNVADCRNVVTGGGATSLWQSGTFGGVLYLEPNGPPTSGVQLGTPTSRLTNQALSINGQATSDIRAINSGSGLAADFEGAVSIGDTSHAWAKIYSQGTVKIGGSVPWHRVIYDEQGNLQVNEGMGSGLDADLANGNQVTLENASNCVDNGSDPRVACVCFTMKYTNAYVDSFQTEFTNPTKITGPPGNIGPGKHCTALANFTN